MSAAENVHAYMVDEEIDLHDSRHVGAVLREGGFPVLVIHGERAGAWVTPGGAPWVHTGKRARTPMLPTYRDA